MHVWEAAARPSNSVFQQTYCIGYLSGNAVPISHVVQDDSRMHMAGHVLYGQRRSPDSTGHTRMRSKKLMDSNISGNPYNMREDIIRRQVTGRATGAGKAVRVWL